MSRHLARGEGRLADCDAIQLVGGDRVRHRLAYEFHRCMDSGGRTSGLLFRWHLWRARGRNSVPADTYDTGSHVRGQPRFHRALPFNANDSERAHLALGWKNMVADDLTGSSVRRRTRTGNREQCSAVMISAVIDLSGREVDGMADESCRLSRHDSSPVLEKGNKIFPVT